LEPQGSTAIAGRDGVLPRPEPRRAGDPRPVRLLGLVLLLAALGAGAGLLAAGASLPPVLPVLGLAAIAGLCVNCEVFFPSELASTAESAAIFAAVVGLHAASPLLGPLGVALAVGPLDLLHWRQRAWFRMAYNSGSQGLAALAGAAVYGRVIDGFGAPAAGAVAAAALAAIPYALTDSSLGFCLMRIRGESVRDAAGHQWSLNAIAIPLACIGASAGVLAHDVGWWCALIVLTPVAWVPELALVRLPAWLRRLPPARASALGAGIAVSAVVTVVAWRSAAPATIVFLVAFAVALGADLRIDRSRLVPPLAALVVVAAAVARAVDPWVVAPLVAVVVTTVAWRARVPLRALVIGAIGGVLAAAVVEMSSARPATVAAVLTAVAAGAAFAVSAVVVGTTRGEPVASLCTLPWSTPLLVVAALLAEVWVSLGSPGAALFGGGTALALATVAWWAAPPWGSRRLGRALAVVLPRRHRAATAGAVGVTLASAGFAVAVPGAHHETALVTAALVEIAAAGGLVAVRQWSFAPQRRAASIAAVATVGTLAVVGYLPTARAHGPASVLVVAGLLAVLVAVVWPLARVLDRAPVASAAPRDRRPPAAAPIGSGRRS
jgi:hypothetical protein